MNYLLLFFLAFSSCIHAQESYVDSKNRTQLWGSVTTDQLREAPFSEWFIPYQDRYQPDTSLIDPQLLSDVQVKIFIGTWCRDTRNWLPAFVKLWDVLDLSDDQLEFIALHNEGEHYKNAPDLIDTLWDIHRVPTFIFIKDQEEIGRIVERPLNNLETDVAQIAAGIPSKPRYRAVTFINDYIEKNGIDTAYAKIIPMSRYIQRMCSGSSELNSYGYVLVGDQDIERAEYIFNLNKKAYPYIPNVHDSLGEFYFNQKKYSEAKECFTEVVRLKGYDKNAIDYLHKIEKELTSK